MTKSPNDSRLEMLDVLKRSHEWIDSLLVAGMTENTVVTAMQTALVERALRAGGVTATLEWLQNQADLAHHLGHAMLAAQETR